jgi:hypothetical protein
LRRDHWWLSVIQFGDDGLELVFDQLDRLAAERQRAGLTEVHVQPGVARHICDSCDWTDSLPTDETYSGAPATQTVSTPDAAATASRAPPPTGHMLP